MTGKTRKEIIFRKISQIHPVKLPCGAPDDVFHKPSNALQLTLYEGVQQHLDIFAAVLVVGRGGKDARKGHDFIGGKLSASSIVLLPNRRRKCPLDPVGHVSAEPLGWL